MTSVASLPTVSSSTPARSSQTEVFPKQIRQNILVGILGIALNLGTTFALIYGMELPYVPAYLAGTLLNVFVSTMLRKRFLKHFLKSLHIEYFKLLGVYILLSFLNLILVSVGVEIFDWHLALVIPAVTLAASAVNFILVGLWAFVYLPIEEVIYEDLDGQFFDDMANPQKVGRFRAWLHRSRYQMTHDFVARYYEPGKKILDFACGSCNWNVHQLPVTGLDVNEKLLQHGLKKNRLMEFRVGDIYRSPFPDESADLIVSSQVFEHLHQPEKALEEVYRVLRRGGIFIIDVPYDLFLGPHFLLFNVHCFIEGYLKGNELYRQRCGHINHFTKRKLAGLLKTQNFSLLQLKLCHFLTLHAAAVKK